MIGRRLLRWFGFIAIAGHLISDSADMTFSCFHACVRLSSSRSREVLLNERCRKPCRIPAQLDRGSNCEWLQEKP